MFRVINGYSFQIRLPFIKGIVHSCDFKRFFKEKNISQIYGLTYDGNKKKLYNIESIKYTNEDIENASKPLSHASLIKNYILGNI